LSRGIGNLLDLRERCLNQLDLRLRDITPNEYPPNEYCTIGTPAANNSDPSCMQTCRRLIGSCIRKHTDHRGDAAG